MIQMKTLLRRDLPAGWNVFPLMRDASRYCDYPSTMIIDETIAPHPFEEGNIYVLLSIHNTAGIRPHWDTVATARDIFIGTGLDSRAERVEIFFNKKHESSLDMWYTFTAKTIEDYLNSSNKVEVHV